MTQASDSLSGLHQSRLLTNCKYADELFAQIESMLACSTSRSAFPRRNGSDGRGECRAHTNQRRGDLRSVDSVTEPWSD